MKWDWESQLIGDFIKIIFIILKMGIVGIITMKICKFLHRKVFSIVSNADWWFIKSVGINNFIEWIICLGVIVVIFDVLAVIGYPSDGRLLVGGLIDIKAMIGLSASIYYLNPDAVESIASNVIGIFTDMRKN